MLNFLLSKNWVVVKLTCLLAPSQKGGLCKILGSAGF